MLHSVKARKEKSEEPIWYLSRINLFNDILDLYDIIGSDLHYWIDFFFDEKVKYMSDHHNTNYTNWIDSEKCSILWRCGKLKLIQTSWIIHILKSPKHSSCMELFGNGKIMYEKCEMNFASICMNIIIVVFRCYRILCL